MSDKVTPLYPEKERKKKLRRRILVLCVIVLAVLAVVLAVLFRDRLNLDRIRRYFTYMTVRGEGYGTYTFDAHSANVGEALGDGLAVASVAGLDVYGPNGEQLTGVAKTLRGPQLAVGSELAVAWDVGRTAICAATADGAVPLDLDAGGTLLDLDVSDGDYICWADAGNGYKTVLTVMDASMREIYKWYSSSQYLPLCSVSDDGSLLAAAAVGQSGGVFESSLVLFSTEREEPLATVSLGNELVLDVEVLSQKRVCTVGERTVRFFDETGAELGSCDYGGEFLTDFALGGNGFVALARNEFQAGSRCSVVTVDLAGQTLAEAYLGTEILSLSAAGNYLAVLTADRLVIYTAALKEYAATEEILGASHVTMRRDGTAILVGSGGAQLYLP
ncbi:MAG: hypothetical protein HFF17_08160 [Oscillospiraceae bacterium]|nr:hypothetical protein [Oscillospiraceae bacterium]